MRFFAWLVNLALDFVTPRQTDVDAVLEREARIIGSRTLLKSVIDKAPGDAELVVLVFPPDGELDFHAFDGDDALADSRVYYLLAAANRLILEGTLGIAVFVPADD
jgi:hypothetical protein